MSPQASIERALHHAERHCASRGHRLTKKRRQVLSGLLESDRAMSAYELVDLFRERRGFELLPMSVYRILAFLEDAGLVHRLELASKYVACAHIACDHAHEVPQFLVCNSCHRVREVAIPGELASTLSRAAEQAGFRLARPQLELDCICTECADGAGEGASAG